MENTEYCGFIFTPEDKETKARRELETNKLMSDQVKAEQVRLQEELDQINIRRDEINRRLVQNGREIRARVNRADTLTQFLALAEEI